MGISILNGEAILYDFSSPGKSGQWQIVNDGVMGGRSRSQMILNPEGTATFKGYVSLENNGGFASVRSFIEPSIPKDFNGITLRVKGDGKIYSIRFRTNRQFDDYAYQSKIKTDENSWQEISIPLEDFNPVFRGRTLENKPPLISENISQMGILIADKQSGSFELTMDWIKFTK